MPDHRLAVRATLIVSIVIAAASALTGCLSQDNSPAPAPPSSSPKASGSPSGPSAPATATPAPTEQPTAVSIPCESVVDAQTMYDFNPNFGLLASFDPASKTLAARAIQNKGTVCRWINQTSRDAIDIAISNPGPTALSAAKNEAKSGTVVNGLGDAAYFSVSGGTGTLQVFDGQLWLNAVSPYFSVPADAMTIMEKAVTSVH